MAEYTSTREGFQRLIEWSLNGPAEQAHEYVEATVTPSFHHIKNGVRSDYDAYLKAVTEWRGKVSDYKPKV